MRVVAGNCKGFRLEYGLDRQLRPTKDRVKEAVFSIIGQKIEGASFLDGYAGSGGIGIEALSRGADYVEFIDIKPRFINSNLESIQKKFAYKFNYLVRDVAFSSAASQIKRSFDIIYLDPPWESNRLFEASLNLIYDFDILAERGLIFLECPIQMKNSFEINSLPFYVQTIRQYGKTMVVTFSHKKQGLD